MQSIQVGTFEAKNRLTHWLAQAERGQRIYITRRGKRIAMLTAAEAPEATPAADMLTQFADFRAAAKRGPESLRHLIEDGR